VEADRDADIARAGANIQAQGDQLLRRAIRTGEDIAAKTPSELRELVKVAATAGLPGAVAVAAVNRATHQSRSSLRPTAPPPRRPQTSPTQTWLSRADQFLENARRLEAEGKQAVDAAIDGAGNSNVVRKIAGDAARTAGNITGIATGAVQTIGDVWDGGVLAARLLNPFDPFMSAPGEAAWDQVTGAAKEKVDYAKRALADPRIVVRDVQRKAGQVRRELDPTATPATPTLAGEIRRNFDIGQNQSELAVELIPYAVGAGELGAAAKLAATTKASRVARHIKQGFTPAQAAHLAEKYPRNRMGHHSVLPQRTTLPDWMGRGPVPKWIMDSPYNVVKPPGISRGEMYELHYKLDPDFRGAKLPGGGWSGKRIGLEEYGTLPRLWHGTPTATKRTLGSGGVAPDLLPLDEYDDETPHLR
jgi:hypothetical protein